MSKKFSEQLVVLFEIVDINNTKSLMQTYVRDDTKKKAK